MRAFIARASPDPRRERERGKVLNCGGFRDKIFDTRIYFSFLKIRQTEWQLRSSSAGTAIPPVRVSRTADRTTTATKTAGTWVPAATSASAFPKSASSVRAANSSASWRRPPRFRSPRRMSWICSKSLRTRSRRFAASWITGNIFTRKPRSRSSRSSRRRSLSSGRGAPCRRRRRPPSTGRSASRISIPCSRISAAVRRGPLRP